MVPVNAILRRLEPIYASRGVRITYTHSLGWQRIGGDNVEQTQEFAATALTGKSRKFKRTEENVLVQVEQQVFHFRVSDLPAGLTPGDLTENDRITVGGETYRVDDIRFVGDLVVRVTVQGG